MSHHETLSNRPSYAQHPKKQTDQLRWQGFQCCSTDGMEQTTSKRKIMQICGSVQDITKNSFLLTKWGAGQTVPESASEHRQRWIKRYIKCAIIIIIIIMAQNEQQMALSEQMALNEQMGLWSPTLLDDNFMFQATLYNTV